MMALPEILSLLIAALVLAIVIVMGYYTIMPNAMAMSKFTPTCTVGLTGGSMPVIDPPQYPAGCVGCSQRQRGNMNCCSGSEVPPVVE